MTDVTDYFIPDLRQDIEALPSDATDEQVRERIDLLAAIINQLLVDLIGDDGEKPAARTK